MKNRINPFIVFFMLLALMHIFFACSPSGENAKKIKAVESGDVAKETSLSSNQKADVNTTSPVVSVNSALPLNIIAQVDGVQLTRGELETEYKKAMTVISGKVPQERLMEVASKIRRQIVDDFIVRTLLDNESKRLKITVTDQEINEATNHLRKTLPHGETLEDMMKKNAITNEKLREEISLGLRINKVVASQPISNMNPTDKEISNFYKNNQDKFKIPETVHARHILISKPKEADETSKAKLKTKAEDLRKQLLAGADFGELAKSNSDCPSKKSGGDLGTFSKGQMVKPFEDAAFSQKKNEIGPIVETDFGFHIIQVLDHQPAKMQSLDKNSKAQITAYLQQRKRYEAFENLMKNLKSKASIKIAEKLD